tara:strand:- start:29535 stop:31364 length:1830 start_codon:yes stop_codon:yes gene_type:complete
MMNKWLEQLQHTLKGIPAKPGVYKMKAGSGKTLYIGKAISLRHRVRSYFQKSASLSPRISVMVSKVRSIEFMLTASEVEALILEDNLIKKEQPPYNVMLRDDKNYPYLNVTMGETFPRLLLVRKVLKDGGMYFGPFVSAKSVRRTMKLIHKIFPLRQSRDNLNGKPIRKPCLNYQMGRCLAPCAGKVSVSEYQALVDQVVLFLRGRNEELLDVIKNKMLEAADNELFELAATYRDQIGAIELITEQQMITDTDLTNKDVIASYENGGRLVIQILQIQNGKMNGERSFVFDKLGEQDRAEAISAFIRQFYNKGMKIPPQILVNRIPEDREPLGERLSEMSGNKVRIMEPLRGKKRKLIEMAENNAKSRLMLETNSQKMIEEALEEIKEKLCLDVIPRHMEAYDISHTSGVSSVGSMVVFRDGVMSNAEYRRYKIRTIIGTNDYASLVEIVGRRLRQVFEKGSDPPDLLIIDGGKGQVNTVHRKLKESGIDPPPMVGLAKGTERNKPESDVFYKPENPSPISFPTSSPGRHLLQRARDEAHRFAISYHKKHRDSSMTRSSLDCIPGMGPKRKKTLLRKFGSVKRIREATLEEFAAAIGLSENAAKKMYEAL